jgi:uncharacterized protein involved in exopolysaccharide biosynthesis
MPDIFYLLAKWWKQILVVVLLSLITATLVLLLSPKKYLSVTTALPASSYNTDKARVFNENIQELYSVLGTADELDMIAGTGKLDTLYLAVSDIFNLPAHYKLSEEGEAARLKAATILKKNSSVMKSEYGELKVRVWDKSKELSPQLANALMEKIQSIHQDLQSESNKATLEGLENARNDLRNKVDTMPIIPGSEINSTSVQLSKYETLIAEYNLIVNSKPPVLLVVEKARAPQKPDKPKPMVAIIVTFFLSLLFGLLLALVLEKKKLN